MARNHYIIRCSNDNELFQIYTGKNKQVKIKELIDEYIKKHNYEGDRDDIELNYGFDNVQYKSPITYECYDNRGKLIKQKNDEFKLDKGVFTKEIADELRLKYNVVGNNNGLILINEIDRLKKILPTCVTSTSILDALYGLTDYDTYYELNNQLKPVKRRKKQTPVNDNTETTPVNDNTETTPVDPDSLKFIDLFCGIGGFHQAFYRLSTNHNLNSHCVMACDIDKNCRKNYVENYSIEPEPDVCKIDIKQLGDIDVICGGFPCQPFSNAGKKKTLNDERGLLFDEIMKIAKEKKPKFMFLENVKHILKVGEGEVIKYIKHKLDTHGYKVQIFNISPHEYGIPQQRERVYFVCIRDDVHNGSDLELIKPYSEIKIKDYLDTKEDIDSKYFIDGDILECLEAWDEMIKIFDVGEKISPTIMINEHYNNHTQEEFDNYADWRKQYITANLPLIEKYKPQWDLWYKKHEEILLKRKIYGKLEWQVGKIKENDSIFNYFIQIRQSGIRVKKAEYFPTLVAISQIPIYGKEKRYITPRECARLQSFPDSFKIDESDKNSYKQFGNAVNVDNVYSIIEMTLKQYGYIN